MRIPLIIFALLSVVGFSIHLSLLSIDNFNVFIALPPTFSSDEDGIITKSELVSFIDGESLTVPKGYQTDLSAIPNWAWSIISLNNAEIINSAILHDYLYSCSQSLTRKEIDSIFYHSLKHEGVSLYNASKAYLAVRLLGLTRYNNAYCHPGDENDNDE